ncbi:MAG: hypothetical protein AB7T17_08090 [Geobacter sp.]
MSEEIEVSGAPDLPSAGKVAKMSRGALQIVGGAIPFAGGVLSAIAGAWSEGEQERVNRFFEHWVRMLQDELKEKEQTIIEIMARVDLQDEAIAARVESKEFQSLVKKTFREWSGAESEEKRVYIRNILANAAATQVSSDDVVRLYIDWINLYSEMHFQVIAAIYNSAGITRGAIWRKIGKGPVREDSADADLYKLLFRDLSTGGIIRQHRQVDRFGNFVAKAPQRSPKGSGPKQYVSAFDTEEGYELTALGQQFVHYAMTELPPKIEFRPEGDSTNE